MAFREVWLTLGAAVNLRSWAGIRRDLQEGPPNRTPSTLPEARRVVSCGLMRLRAGLRHEPLPDQRRLIPSSTLPHLPGDALIKLDFRCGLG
jgi:hypothetical protein